MSSEGSPFVSSPHLDKNTLYLGRSGMPTRHGEFDIHFFHDLARDRIAMAIVCGEWTTEDPLLARVHSSCLTSECLSGQDCDCADQLDAALGMMGAEGAGVLFYLMQEGRGAGLTAKARDRMIVQASGNRKTTFDAYAEMGLPADLRRYEALAPMARMLGLRAPLRLLTNNPDKAAAVMKILAEEGILVCRTEKVHGPTSAFNRDYLMAKHDSGHSFLSQRDVIGASPPSAVRVIPPIALLGSRHRVLTASYFLPIALFDTCGASGREHVGPAAQAPTVVEWYRMSVIFEGETARESVLLSHAETSFAEIETELGRGPEAGSHGDEIAGISMSLLDRLPATLSGSRFALCEALTRIRDAGAGSVAIRFDDHVRMTGESTKPGESSAFPHADP